MPSSLEMIGELNGFLINSHNILDVPRLQPETFVNVGGLQIKRKLDPLPEEITQFVEEAEEGVMLLALGFLFDPRQVPEERMDRWAWLYDFQRRQRSQKEQDGLC